MKAMTLLVTFAVILYSQSLTAQATIYGKVYNYTTNQKVNADWIVLAKTGQGLETTAQFENASEYRFENVAPAPSPYLVRVSYGDVIYSQTLQVPESREYQVDVIVYESTAKWENMIVRVPHMIVVRNGNQLNVEQTYEITNQGRKTYHAKDHKLSTFEFKLPDKVTFRGVMTSYNGSIPLQAVAMDVNGNKGVNVDLKPGTTQVQVTYSADYSSATASLDFETATDLTEFNVFVTPHDVSIAAARFTAMNDEEMKANNFAVYRATNVRRGESLAMTLMGGSSRQAEHNHDDGGSIVAAENAVQAKAFGWIALFLSLLCLLLFFGVQKKKNLPAYQAKEKGKPSKAKRNDLTKERDRLAAKIADLDDAFSNRDLDEKTYHKQRAPLKTELRRVVETLHH